MTTQRPTAPLCTMIALVVVCVFSSALVAQDSSIYGRDVNQVYVRDSAGAVEKIALAERMEHLREWSKAADAYQDVLANFGDRVVSSKIDDEKRIIQYSSVVTEVQKRLGRWPDEGIAAYRARFEVEAQAMLDSAKPGDLATLQRVVSTYFISEAARVAGMRLVDAQLEAGEFAGAAWTAQRLLDLYPNLAADRAPLLYRAALAYHYGGDDAQAKARLNELQQQFPETLGRVRGQDVRLAESLEPALQEPRPVLASTDSDSWPMAFGSPDRARIPKAVTSVGARLFSIPLTRVESMLPRGTSQQVQAINEPDRAAGFMTGVYPAVDHGELFFQDNVRVYAVSLESGVALPGWVQTYPGEAGGRYTVSNCVPTPRGHVLTVSVTDDSVLAIMGLSDAKMMSGAGYLSLHDTRLVCLDRKTGREKWVVRPQSLAGSAPPAVANALRDMDLSGSPLVVGDNVYAILRGGKGLQFEDCYVLCLDVDTGKYKWATYVASANSQGQLLDDFTLAAPQSVSHLAYASGRVFCLTNLGAVAALGAYDGTIAWLNVYPREEFEGGRIGRRFQPLQTQTQPRKPWTFNPVIVADQKVFVLPNDGKNLHVYDAGSGNELKRIDENLSITRRDEPASRTHEQINTLLGVMDGKLVVASDHYVLCFDWTKFDSNRMGAQDITWIKELPPPTSAKLAGRVGASNQPVRGRAFLTTERLFLPTAWNLQPLNVATGGAMDTFPPGGWGPDDEPGNVLATGEHLIIAGPTQVSVYTDLTLALRRLDAAIAAAPSDPDARLRYAEITFVSKQRDLALQKIDEAITLLGGRQSLAPGAARERLYADLMTFARGLMREASGPNANASAKKLVDELFDRAVDAAQTPLQQVNVRLARAEYAHGTNDLATEMKLYQEILTQPAWRSAMVARTDAGGSRPAGLVASDAISQMLARPDGKSLYEPFEKQANDALEAARVGNDPAKLLEIAQAYPNSNTSRQAALLAADALEAAGNPRDAVQALRQVYFRTPNAPDRAKIIESLARNYLAMPNHLDVAIARLAQGSKLPGNLRLSRPLRLPDGQVLKDVTFGQALAAVSKLQSNATAVALPDLHLPAVAAANAQSPPAFKPAEQTPVIEGITTLCVPNRDFTRGDRVVVESSAGLAAYAPGTDQPKFSTNALGDAPRGIAWTGGNLIAWTADRIAMFDGESGATVWDLPLSSLPSTNADAPSLAANVDANGNIVDANAQLAGLQLNGRLVVRGGGAVVIDGAIVRQGGQVLVRNGQFRIGRNGRVMPVRQPPQPAALNIPANGVTGEQIVSAVPLGDRVMIGTTNGRIAAVDLIEGKVVWQAKPVSMPIDKMAANDDFVVVRYSDPGGSQLFAMETSQGQIVFRRKFSATPVAPLPLVNFALSTDGTLVWAQPDRLAAKDLFEPGDDLRYGEGTSNSNSQTYLSATGDDQFVIAEGRVFAVTDGGTQVRIHSLESGKLLRTNGGQPMIIATGKTDPNSEEQAQVRVVGSTMYIVSRKRALISAYRLEPFDHMWDSGGTLGDVTPKQVLVGRDNVVAVGESYNVRRRQPGNYKLLLYSRGVKKGVETGALDFEPYKFVEPLGVLAWQAVDGGVYYLAGDHRLHFLAGAEK